jgi:hypothetical protein
MKHIVFLLTSTITLFSATAVATEYYVNPSGNDTWSGMLKQANSNNTDGPFKTLSRAKQVVRSLKKANQLKDKVNVNIATGTYYLSQSLSFDLTDSGLLGKEIVWQGEPGSNVVISGGIPLPCTKQTNGTWECPVDQAPAAITFFDIQRVKGNSPRFELFVNDQKMVLARWPDKGWAHVKAPISSTTQFSALQTLPTLTGDIKSAQIHTFAGNDWFDQIIGISAVNTASNSITLSSASTYPFEAGRRFYIQNIQSALDAPSEWMYNATNKKITFIAPIGVVPQQVNISSLPTLITTVGANYLSFQNLSFEHSTATAINVKNSNDMRLDHLNINNVGGIGLAVDNGNNIQITNSDIENTGSSGITITGGDRNTLKSSGNIINNNHVHSFGTTLMTLPGIVASGVGMQISHNLIEEGPGIGIRVSGNDNLIEKNELYHLCLQSWDCGAFYSGRDWTYRGNVFRYNYIHDIIGYGLAGVDLINKTAKYTSPSGARGVYLDDAVSGFEIASNIIDNAGDYSVQIGGGRDNKIHDNFINTTHNAIYIDNRWDTFNWATMQANLNAVPYKSAVWANKYPELVAPMNNYKWPEGNHIERNIIVTNNSKDLTLYYIIPANSSVIADNVIWNTTKNIVFMRYLLLESQMKADKAWTDWLSENLEQGSISTDPCASIVNKSVVLCATSAAKTIGFAAMPTDIGLVK